MKRSTEIFESELTPQATDKCSEIVREFVTSLKLPGREASRYAMTVEEILLDCADGSQCEKLRLTTGKRFFRNCITLEIFGQKKNVFHKNESGSILSDSLLNNLGLSPEYSYNEGVNTYSFRIKKKTVNPFISLAVAVAGSVLLGLIGRMFFTSQLLSGIVDGVLNPLHDTFLNMLSCISGPMVFFAVAWGIYGIGDAATLKKVGKKLLTGYIGTVFIITVLFTFLCLPVFRPHITHSATGANELSAVMNMILGIIPKNIFSPFTEGNTLQIIFLSVVFGVAMLFLGKKTAAVATAVEQINCLVQYLIELISKLIPYFIFVVVLDLIWSGSALTIASTGKYLITGACCILSAGIAILLAASLIIKVNPVRLARGGLSTLIIALTTASSSASFSENMNACRKSYGISDSVSSFGIPLGIVTFKPATTINFLTATLFFASFYQLDISVSWLIMMILSVVILAVATPPVPGGAIMAYTVLFTLLGIPTEAIAIVLACDPLFDFLDTGIDQYTMPFVILPQANKLGMVDRAVLTGGRR